MLVTSIGHQNKDDQIHSSVIHRKDAMWQGEMKIIILLCKEKRPVTGGGRVGGPVLASLPSPT